MRILASGTTDCGDSWWVVHAARAHARDSGVHIIVARARWAACSCDASTCTHIAGLTAATRVTPEDLGYTTAQFFPAIAARCKIHRRCWWIQSPLAQGIIPAGRSHLPASMELLHAVTAFRIPWVNADMAALLCDVRGPLLVATALPQNIRFQVNGPDAQALLAEVPGITWHDGTAFARYTWPVAQLLQDERVDVDDALAAWLSLFEERRLLSRDSGDREMQTLSGLRISLYPHQRAFVEYVRRFGRALLADEMGFGKTRESLAAVEVLQRFPALILVEPNALYDFHEALLSMVPVGRSVQIIESGKERYRGADYVVTTHDLFPRLTDLRKVRWSSFVIDEADHYANRKTQRFRALRTVAKQPSLGLRIAMTGTPYRNEANDYVAILELLNVLEEFGGREHFIKQYCNAVQVGRGWRTSGAANAPELYRALSEICLIRRTDRDIDLGIPDQAIEHIQVRIDNRRSYDAATSDIIAFLYAHNLVTGFDDLPEEQRAAARLELALTRMSAAQKAPALVLRGTQRRLSEVGKVAACVERVQALLAERPHEKVVVFCNYRDTIDALVAQLPRALTIHGEMRAKDRFESKKRFQEDPSCRLIVCGMQAGKKNLTLTAGTRIMFLGLPWTRSDFDQACRRIRRIGQTRRTFADVLEDPHTIDRYCWDVMNGKGVLAAASLDGDAPPDLLEAS